MNSSLMIYLGVFALYFLFIAYTSVRSAKQVESMEDFTSGGHRMGLFLGIGTSLATWVSVASVMGVPGNLYSRGFAAVIGWISGWFFATAVMPIIAYKVRFPKFPTRTFPEFMRLRYEPLEKKSKIQLLVAAVMVVGYFIFSVIQVQGFGIVFSTITGIQYEYAIFFFLLVLIFTSMGGFFSVAATDTLNAALILLGVSVAAISVLSATGGIGPIMETISTTTAPAMEGGEPIARGILATPLGTYSLATLSSIFLSNALGSIAAPHWVARFMAPKNAKAAALQMSWSLVLLVFIFIPLVIIGLGAKTLLPSIPIGRTTDYLMPMVIMQHTPPVIGAVALVGICAAAVSTANSMLLHCATSLVYDIKRGFSSKKQTDVDDNKTTRILRFVIFGLGVLAVLIAYRPFTLLAMGFTYVYGSFASVFFWPVIFGLFWKRMNRAGAYASIVFGLIGYLYAMITQTSIPAFFVGTGLSLVACLICVFATSKPPKEAYEAYFELNISPETEAVIHRIRQDGLHE